MLIKHLLNGSPNIVNVELCLLKYILTIKNLLKIYILIYHSITSISPCNLLSSALARLSIYKAKGKPVPKFLNLVGFLCPIYLYICMYYGESYSIYDLAN